MTSKDEFLNQKTESEPKLVGTDLWYSVRFLVPEIHKFPLVLSVSNTFLYNIFPSRTGTKLEPEPVGTD